MVGSESGAGPSALVVKRCKEVSAAVGGGTQGLFKALFAALAFTFFSWLLDSGWISLDLRVADWVT